VIYKFLGKLSKIYKTLKIEKFIRLIGPLDFNLCSNIIHFCTTNEYIDIKIDQQRNLIIFSDHKKDLHDISKGILNLSEHIKDITELIDEAKESKEYDKKLALFRQEATNYIDNAA